MGLKFFSVIVMAQVFFSMGATILTYTYVPLGISTDFTDPYSQSTTDLGEFSQELESATQSKLNIPLLDLGAMLFYTGNIIIDFFLNFLFAIPSLLTLIFNGFFMFFASDAFITSQLKLFFFVFASFIYFVNVIAMLVEIRSGRQIT